MIWSIASALLLPLLLRTARTEDPELEKLQAFEKGESIFGLLLLGVCLAVYVRQRPKVKYVEFESFEADEKGKSGSVNTEVKLDHPLHDPEPNSHKTIAEHQPTTESISIEKRRRKRKVDRLHGLTKKDSETDIQDGAQQYRDSCIEVE